MEPIHIKIYDVRPAVSRREDRKYYGFVNYKLTWEGIIFDYAHSVNGETNIYQAILEGISNITAKMEIISKRQSIDVRCL